MGRYITGASSSTGTSNSALQPVNTVVTTGEAVAQGQIAVLGGDGLAYYAVDPNANAVLAAQRPISQLTNVYNGLQLPASTLATSANNGSSYPNMSGCVLSNGNYVVAWGVTVSNKVQFGIYNAGGLLQGAVVVVGTQSSSILSLNVVPLSGGGFALLYVNGTNNPVIAVYNNSGTVVLGATVVEAVTSILSISLTALTSGGFAVAYFNSTGFVYRYAVFSATGTVVLAPATVTTGTAIATYANSVSICTLSGGGFVVSCGVTNGTNSTTWFALYNNAGVIQGALTSAGANTSTSGGFITSVGLVGGGFALAINATGIGQVLQIWSAAGVQVGGTLTLASAVWVSPNGFAISALPNGNVAFACAATSTDKSIAYANGTTGALIASQTGTAIPVGTSMGMSALSNNGVVIHSNNGVTQLDANCAVVGPLNSAVPGVISGANYICIVLQLTSTPFVTWAVASSSTNVTMAVLNATIQKRTPIGVFAASAASAASVPVQYVGNITLSTGFVQPYAINQQSASPPGVKMSIVGNSAILYGIQAPATQRNIN